MSRYGVLGVGTIFLLGCCLMIPALTFSLPPPVITPVTPISGLDPQRVALGAALFGDPRLSAHGRISCRSCHDDTSNGASLNARDRGDDGTPSRFNTPTVFNAALSFRLSWQGHFRTMPTMMASLLASQHVMGGTQPGLRRLNSDPHLARQARLLYGHPFDDAALADALANYMDSLVTPGSRFDRYLAGDAGALTTQEKRGWTRFRTVGCTSCHQGANVGGNLYERHGIFHPLASPDPPMLRVPSLRNVATTPPYFHDGSAKDLRHAIRSMARAQLDLSLSDSDVTDIAAFLGSLTGSWNGHPVSKPAR